MYQLGRKITMKEELYIVLISIIFILSASIIQNTDALFISGDSLYNDILYYAESNDVIPIDARCDKVWYKVPGINGKIVDIEKSQSNMDVFDESKIIYKLIEQEINIYDLTCSPIYRGNEESDSITLIINVAWGEEFVIRMLDILDSYDTKANFFFEGKFADNNKELVFEVYARGHVIGNHSYSHPDMSNLTTNEVSLELSRTNNILSGIIFEEISYFGPPSGSYNDLVLNSAKKLNLETIMWSVDTIDWQKPSKDVIVDRVKRKLHPGAIILMHPTENTCLALPEIIGTIKKNYQIETLDDFLT